MDDINDIRDKVTDLSDRLTKVETWQEAQERNLMRVESTLEKMSNVVERILEKMNKFDGKFEATITVCGIVSPIIFGLTQFIISHWVK